MMKNMIKELLKARRKIFTENEFEEIILKLKGIDDSNIVNWDDGVGEEWAFVNNSDMSIMLNRRIGICFIRGEVKEVYLNVLKHCNCVWIESFDIREWYIDLETLQHDIPEIKWPLSNDGVNPKCFSLDEFYFETV